MQIVYSTAKRFALPSAVVAARVKAYRYFVYDLHLGRSNERGVSQIINRHSICIVIVRPDVERVCACANQFDKTYWILHVIEDAGRNNEIIPCRWTFEPRYKISKEEFGVLEIKDLFHDQTS